MILVIPPPPTRKTSNMYKWGNNREGWDAGELIIPSVLFVAREKCIVLAEGTRKIREFAFVKVSFLWGIIRFVGGT